MSPEEYQQFLKDGQVPGEAKVPKPSKYGNHKVEWGGMKFDSKWELERWLQLVAMETAGEIRALRRQVPHVLQPSFVHLGEKIRAIRYFPDFQYFQDDGTTNWLIIEDAKGHQTDVFRLKWKLLQYLHCGERIKFVLSRKGEKVNDPK